MTTAYSPSTDAIDASRVMPDMNPKPSAVAWTAILAGAAAAMVVTLVMSVLGGSLGLASVSPWDNEGASATGFTVGMIVWLMLTQWSSSALGGYLAGRLRTRWNYLHNDEVFFRDTAHGFLTWSVATLVTVMALSSMVHSHMQTAATLGAGAMAAQGAEARPMGPRMGPDVGIDRMAVDAGIDMLLRSDAAGAPAAERDSRDEIVRIAMKGVKNDGITEDDKNYLSQLVARRTNIAPDEARRRVDNLAAELDAAKVKAKDMADKARKAAASAGLLTVLSMILGAFVASAAAALGGRQRDL